ncbi:MAG: hypothetical protein A3I66_08975 [Burkholderiales bacterium RIFCSPLOWO2_02_FULL_57_36]|nr:MAG: hypothetical protein A3I66_08975 [Burkholderiales bacterium RIFCSPLOWO2_02_FULL_57_36]
MKRCLIACCLALACLSSQAAAPVAKIQSMLAKPKAFCGNFEQTKHLEGFKKPLMSSGRFCVVAGKGVLWRTLQPFPSTLRLTRNEIVQMQGERVAMRLDAQQEPMVRTINSVLFSLLAGDLTQLETMFDVDGSVRGDSWGVLLKAREPALAKAIGGVQIEGAAFVRNIVISEAGGDRTSIAFSGMVSGTAAFTAEEAKAFE